MSYILRYHEDVARDVEGLDPNLKIRIHKVIETKLLTRPEVFGKPLRKSLMGLRTLRVGDYRVIFLLKGQTITIAAIKHRSNAYKRLKKIIL